MLMIPRLFNVEKICAFCGKKKKTTNAKLGVIKSPSNLCRNLFPVYLRKIL